MSHRRFAVVLLFFTGIIVGFIYFLGMCIDLEDTIRPEDYLALLNDNDTYGCKNSIRIHPEVLVLGDSHAYTAFDFNMLAEALGTYRIAACTLGGSYTETFLFALKHYESLGELPKTIIYSTSPRQFWEDGNKARMLFSQKAQIASINEGDLLFSIQNIFAWLFIKNENAHQQALARVSEHTPLVEGMNEDDIGRVLKDSESTAENLKRWLRSIQEAQITDGSEEMVREIGDIVRRNGINLIVVAIPESAWLEAQYPDWLRDNYYALLDQFRPFARRVLIYTTSDVGLGNRHFINRSLKSGYDYGKWSDPDYLDSSGLNADHIGAVGAVLFTKKAAKDIVDALK
ncbi:hypothetical protein JCM14722_05200 [Pseudodesulfovibrio portus]|uniref:SGNH/GDSL hydrolase family protein n=2 Tax=Pseudodesulfovibrio portus TaxID=231439 RepID=A0ABM8ANM9_9BACT|nr:hypothetical protein JCM14722_05200 [Pseudodesulfovibrio portus]